MPRKKKSFFSLSIFQLYFKCLLHFLLSPNSLLKTKLLLLLVVEGKFVLFFDEQWYLQEVLEVWV